MVSFYPFFIVVHIISVIVAVGGATIVDYLHLVGLKRKSLEKGLVKIYPHISNMINISLIAIYLSGAVLVFQNISILSSPLFKIKLLLVIIVTLNGIYLQKSVSPHLDKCIIHGTKYCTSYVLNSSAISGSISIVTWYSIVILSLTKNLGYTYIQFIYSYIAVLVIAIVTSYSIELRARNWRK
jgi:hypothetical protein